MVYKELVSDEPRKAYLREYTDKRPDPGNIRVTVQFAAAKHGTEFAHFRGIDPLIDNRYDEEYQLFMHKSEVLPDSYFMRPGNMWVGYVSELGEGVERFHIGDRIAGYGPIRSTQTISAEEALVMPERMTWKEAVCYDPAQFAMGGIRDGNVRIGDNVVISGLGAIGLIAAQFAKLAGALKVIVCDPIEHRRNVALENGADYAIDSSEADVGLEIKKLTNKRGADVVIETSGNYKALQQGIRGAAYNGNVAVVGWFHECFGGLDLGREAHFNQPNILISRACSEPNREYPRWSFKRICDTCWEMLGQGMLKCENIVDPVVPLDESAKAYMAIEQNPGDSVKLGVKF